MLLAHRWMIRFHFSGCWGERAVLHTAAKPNQEIQFLVKIAHHYLLTQILRL